MGWFTPKCPVDPDTKEWIDHSFDWLINEIGLDTVRAVEMLLPTEEHFPDPYDGTELSIRKMFDRVCGYMDVDPEAVNVRFFRNEDGSSVHQFAASESGHNAIGTYSLRNGKYHIDLDTAHAGDPQAMIATIAHELGHVILLGEGRLDPDYEDHEPMTDLLTVFYGFGVFSGNSVFSFQQWTNASGQGWRAERRGYLTEEMFGYALALFALLRGELKPDWEKELSTNVRHYFRSASKFVAANPPIILARHLQN
jgi:hypothetical protein